MAGINQYLSKILSSKYGKDVRQSIHDAIKQTYNDTVADNENFQSYKNTVLNLTSFIKTTVDVSKMVFEIGTYNTEGLKYDDSDYIRTAQMFPVPKKYTCTANIRLYVYYYDSDLTFISREYFPENGDTEITFAPPDDAVLMNIVIGDYEQPATLSMVERLNFIIYGEEYKTGYSIPAMHNKEDTWISTELYVSDSDNIIAKCPATYNGHLKLYKNGRFVESYAVGWQVPTIIENTKDYDFAILELNKDSGEDLGNSFVFGVNGKDRCGKVFDSSLSKVYSPTTSETGADASYVKNPTDIYFLVRFPTSDIYSDSTSQNAIKGSYGWSCCVLRLPKNYTQHGKKVPISFFTHGTSGWVGNGAVQSQFNRCQYLLDNGIACFDVNGWIGCYGGELPPDNRKNGQNMGNPGACVATHKAFEYIRKIYNVEDRCLVFGNSMGGLLALNYANNYRNDILGVFLLYPIIDLKGQAWDSPWNDHCHSNILSYYHMSDTYDEKKAYGYNPYLNNYAGIPIFIWHGTSDTTADPQTSENFRDNQNQNGGSVFLRMVDGLPHGNYDNWRNIFENETLTAINRFVTIDSSWET